jgi:hypothetical protein
VKKQGWLIFLTIGLALVLVFSDEASEASEEILCWSQDEERCFVFLPSYADLSKTEVQLIRTMI